MSTTIDSLEIQIKTQAGSSAVDIDALATSLSNLNKSSNLTKVTNNLTKLSGALTALKTALTGMPSMQPLENLMSSLSGIQKLTNLNSAINTLKKIPEITKSIDATAITQFTERMSALAKALDPLATKINHVSAGFARLPTQVSKTVTAVNRMSSASRTAAESQGKLNHGLDTTQINLASVVANAQTYLNAIQQIVRAIGELIKQAIEWDGVQARFGRAFGDSAEAALEKVEKISESLKINKLEFMQYTSLFSEMLAGFGVNQADANEMAFGYTELAYDIWAAYNDVYKTLDGEEGAIAAVRSAISGEVEPIRRAGFTIVDSQLAVTAAMYGVEYSTQKATEAQKSYLRYLTMVDQATKKGLVGVYAAEMVTAEGAVRTLNQQLKSLYQSLGSLFIPILQAVVPWLSAFVELLTEAIAAIAEFFGIPFFEIDWSRSDAGLENIETGAEGAQEELKKASEEAKKLKDYTMGFDELNVINPDSGSAGGGSDTGSGAGWDSLPVDSLWDDAIFGQTKKQIDEIKEKLKDVLKLVGLIATGFLAWKIASGFLNTLDTVKATISALRGGVGGSAGLSALTFLGKGSFAKTLASLGKLGTILAGSKVLSGGIIPAIVGTGGTATLGTAIAGVAVFAAAITGIIAGLVMVYKESENFRKGLSTIWDGLVWVVKKIGEGIGWIGDKIGELGSFLAESLSGIIPQGLIDFFGALELGIGDLLLVAGGLALFGPWGLLIEGVVLAIKLVGHAASDSLEPVNLFAEGISEATKEKVEPFIERMDELERTLKTLDWSNAIVDEDDLQNIGSKLKTIVETIVNELDSDKNEALAKLDPLRAAMSEEKFAELQAKIEESYATQRQTVFDGEARINEILAKASEEARALTAEEAAEIERIQWQMKETGVKYLSESETESNLILQRLKDNASQLSAEQASEIIKNALSAKNETVAMAKEQYDGILMEAQRMLDTGTITKAEYDEIVKAAEKTRDDTVSAAETQYENIVDTAKTQMGEYARYIDTETGEIKSNWKVFCEDVSAWWNNTWSSIKDWWNKNIAPFFTKKFWEDTFNSIKTGITNALASAKKSITDKWSEVKNWWNTNVAPKFTKKYWAEKFDVIRSNLKSKLDEAWKAVTNFFSIEEWKKKINEAMQSIKDNFKMPSFPKIKLGVTYDTNVGAVKKAIYEALGLDGWPKLSWTTYAQGGFPSVGQMFIAREAGPELVGTINGRSAVANNDQIVAAVSQGVYSAVVAAMGASASNGDQAINVYLDGKQITAAVEKRQKERGATLMTGGMAYGY